MAKCQFCEKDVAFGIKVSHSHRRSNRTWKPNVKRVKAIVDGSPKHVYVWHSLPPGAARSPALCDLIFKLPETSLSEQTTGFFRFNLSAPIIPASAQALLHIRNK